jgi:hypothetical protein
VSRVEVEGRKAGSAGRKTNVAQRGVEDGERVDRRVNQAAERVANRVKVSDRVNEVSDVSTTTG